MYKIYYIISINTFTELIYKYTNTQIYTNMHFYLLLYIIQINTFTALRQITAHTSR